MSRLPQMYVTDYIYYEDVTDDVYEDVYYEDVTDDVYEDVYYEDVTDDVYEDVYYDDVTDDVYAPAFKDLENYSWAQHEIETLHRYGYITGKGDDSFFPQDTITRAEFITILARTIGGINEEIPNTVNFTDLEPNAYYTDAVNFAAYFGIVQGDGGKFRPNDPISRQEMATIITRAYTVTNGLDLTTFNSEGILSNYTDRNDVSSWAKNSVAYLIDLGVIRGVTSDQIAPAKTATRAEAAVMIYRSTW